MFLPNYKYYLPFLTKLSNLLTFTLLDVEFDWKLYFNFTKTLLLSTITKEKWFQFDLHCGISAAIVSFLCFTSDESLVHSIHLCTDVYRGTQCYMQNGNQPLNFKRTQKKKNKKETENFLRRRCSTIKGAADTLHSS